MFFWSSKNCASRERKRRQSSSPAAHAMASRGFVDLSPDLHAAVQSHLNIADRVRRHPGPRGVCQPRQRRLVGVPSCVVLPIGTTVTVGCFQAARSNPHLLPPLTADLPRLPSPAILFRCSAAACWCAARGGRPAWRPRSCGSMCTCTAKMWPMPAPSCGASRAPAASGPKGQPRV